MAERKVLGKGLGALIPDMGSDEMPDKAIYCPQDSIKINPHQPRTEYNQQKIQELADSIKEKGVIQPLLVKELENGYQLIAGERRLRAATLAGLKKVPVIVKKVTHYIFNPSPLGSLRSSVIWILTWHGSSNVHIFWLAYNVSNICVLFTGLSAGWLAALGVFRNYHLGFNCRICCHNFHEHRNCNLFCGKIAIKHKRRG